MTLSHNSFATLRFLVAWGVASGAYLLAVVLTVLDGFPSIILQPIISVFAGGLCAGVGTVLGMPLWLLQPYRWFRRWGILLSVICAGCGATLFVFSMFPSEMKAVTDPETGEMFRELGNTALSGYLLLVGGLANVPYPFEPPKPR